jgi:hypothetical protein
MSPLRASRRDVLTGAGLALAASAMPATSPASALAGVAAEAGALVVLQDPQLPLPADVQQQLSANGASALQLAADPVRMWRGEHAPLLAARATRLLGVTSWPNFLMVRGLAEESGRRVRYQRFDVANNAMVWLIA